MAVPMSSPLPRDDVAVPSAVIVLRAVPRANVLFRRGPPTAVERGTIRHVPPQLLLDAAFVAIGYLFGSLPMGVLVARLTGAPDPRGVGSGRTGGTNALRAMGARRAV